VGTVRVAFTFPGSVAEAERCWYDTARWPEWVDGMARVLEVRGDWPLAGASVSWESGPAGRGRVLERVLEHEALEGQTVAVADDSITGRQQVRFTPANGEVEVELSLSYRLKRRSLLTPLVDPLFIRSAVAMSLRRTLSRFGAQLAASRLPDLG
jgi:hypothetical protein